MLWRRLALVLVLLLCSFKALTHRRHAQLEDFRVYNTAGMLVREHQSVLIYNGADTGVDPQLRLADPGSSFAKTAQAMGVRQVRLYVYPPLLADLMVPFTYFNAPQAGRLWVAFNVSALIAFVLLVRAILHLPWISLGMGALVLGVFIYLPVTDCLQWGQITNILLLLWTIGIFCYSRRWMNLSAVAIALATAIKLTPVIILLPILLWKDWRWIRAYAVALFACLGLICLLNGPTCLSDYFRHVMPAMSNGNPFMANKSLLASFQILYVTLKGGDPTVAGTHIPAFIPLVGKATALIFLLIAGVLVARSKSVDLQFRAVALSLFAMLSTAIAPVSWEHAYAVCLLALVLLWAEALRTQISVTYLVVLTLCSLELSWFMISFVILRHVHGVAIGLTTFLTPLSAVILVLYRLSLHTPSVRSAEKVVLASR